MHILHEEISEELGGTMRLGSHLCKIKPETLAYQIYQQDTIEERHRHSYTINTTAYKEQLTAAGMIFSGETPNTDQFTEIIELTSHPFFVGVQYHPEFNFF